MNTQIVMDSHVDTRHDFDPDNAASIAQAEARFRQLTGKGFTAVALGRDGSPGTLLRHFDREAEQTMFIPQRQGG